MTSVLVIGGSELARRQIAAHLPTEGFEPLFVAEGREGIAMARRGSFAIVLLDWVLPDMPGSEVCRQLKANAVTRQVPVIVVTALNHEIDRIVAFELGAVDYVVDPFSVRELSLRLRVAIDSKTPPAPTLAPRDLDAVLALDVEARRALVRGQEIPLSPRELAALAALLARPGIVLSRTQLRQEVWGAAQVSLRTVDASMKRLRRKLGPARYAIETVRGVGYRFRSAGERGADTSST